MPDYSSPLEVAIKLLADPSQIIKTIQQLEKQGIKLPSSLDQKDIDKCYEDLQNKFKANNIKLSVDKYKFSKQIQDISDQAQKSFDVLKTSLRAVFESTDGSGLEKKVHILQDMTTVMKNMPKGVLKDVSFSFNDKEVLTDLKQYYDLLNESKKLLGQQSQDKMDENLQKNHEATKLGLENLYNTAKKVLPQLLSDFKNLTADGSTDAETLIAKFTELYSVFQMFKGAGKDLTGITGVNMPKELNVKKYQDVVNLSDAAFESGGKINKRMIELLGSHEKYKEVLANIRGDQEKFKSVGLKAIESTVTVPSNQVNGLNAVADAQGRVANATANLTNAQNNLSGAMTGTPIEQATETFTRLAGVMDKDTAVSGELQNALNAMFSQGSNANITIEQIDSIKAQVKELIGAFEVLKESRQLASATNGGVTSAQGGSFKRQLDQVDDLMTKLKNYMSLKEQVNNLEAQASAIKPVNGGVLSSEQENTLIKINEQIALITPQAQSADQALSKMLENLKNYSTKGQGNYFTRFKTGTDTGGMQEVYKIKRELNGVVGVIEKITGVINAGETQATAQLSNKLSGITQYANETISTSAKIATQLQAEANAQNQIKVSYQHIVDLKQLLIDKDKQIRAISNEHGYAAAKAAKYEQDLVNANKLKEELSQKAGALTAEQENLKKQLEDAKLINEELAKKNALMSERSGNVTVEQFNSIKDSVIELNKILNEKSNGLSTSSQKDIECFNNIKQAVLAVTASVKDMYANIGNADTQTQLGQIRNQLENIVPASTVTATLRRLNNLKPKIARFDATGAIEALKVNIERELSKVQFSFKGTAGQQQGYLTSTMEYLGKSILEVYGNVERVTNEFKLTDEQIKSVAAQSDKVLQIMSALKVQKSLSSDDIGNITKQKKEILQLIDLYQKYNAAIKSTKQIESEKSELQWQSRIGQVEDMENAFARINSINVSGVNDTDNMKKYIAESNELSKLANTIRSEYAALKLPEDLYAQIESLSNITKTGLDSMGVKNLLNGYKELQNQILNIQESGQEAHRHEKIDILNALDNLNKQREMYTQVNSLLKEMNTLSSRANNRELVNPESLSQLRSLSSGLSEAYKKVQIAGSGGNGTVPDWQLNRLNTTLTQTIAKFNQLKPVIENSIGSDKTVVSVSKLQYQLNKLITDMALFRSQNSTFTKDTALNQEFNSLLSSMQSIQAEGKVTGATLMQLKSQFTNFKTSVQLAGKMGRSFGDELSYIAGKIGVKALLGGFTYKIISYFKQMIDNVKNLDTAMTALKRVTDETQYSYDKFAENMAKSSKNLGVGYSDLVNSVAEFSKLGYQMNQATKLGEAASIYSKVSWQDIDSAVKSMTSIIKAFDISSDKSMDLVDKLNIVGNKYAVSSADIGEGLQRSASSLRTANNTLEQSIALFTGGQEVVQNAEKVGTALNAVSMRIRGAKAELEDAGEETEGLCDSTSKLRDAVGGLSGVDIMIDDSTFKSTYDILGEIAKVWDKLSDKSRASLLEIIAGKNRANVVSSILNNWKSVESAMGTMTKASKTAEKELGIVNDSIEGRLAKLSSTFESLSSSFIKSDDLKNVISFLTTILDTIQKVTDKVGGLGAAIEGVLMFKAFRGNGALNIGKSMFTQSGFGLSLGKNLGLTETLNNMKEAVGLKGKLDAAFNQPIINSGDIASIGKYNELVKSGTSETNAFSLVKSNLSKNAQNLILNTQRQTQKLNEETGATNKAIVATDQYTSSQQRMTVAQKLGSSALGFAAKAFSALVSMGTTMLLMMAFNKIVELIRKQKEALEETKKLAEENAKQTSGLAELRDEYSRICTEITNETDKTEALDAWKRQLIETYGVEEDALKSINGTRKDGIDLINQEIEAQQQAYLAENRKSIKKAREYVEKNPLSNIATGGLLNSFGKGGQSLAAYNKTLKDIADSTTSTIDFTQRLVDLQKELANKETLNKATQQDKDYLGFLEKDIAKLNKHLKDDGFEEIYTQAAQAEMNAIAKAVSVNEKYVDIYQKTYGQMNDIVGHITSSQESDIQDLQRIADEHKVSLEDLLEAYKAFGNYSVLTSTQIDAFKDSLQSFNIYISFLPDSVEALIQKLLDLQNELDTSSDKFSGISTKIGEARTKLEGLSGILSKQQDPSATYSSDELSELLDKYPQLWDYIDETKYGYRLQEDGVNKLKTSILEKQKTELQASLNEQVAVRNGVMSKLQSYSSELKGISDVASAKTKLAELEEQLNNPKTATNTSKLNELNQEKDLIQQYIATQDGIDGMTAQALALQTQIDILGKDFESIDKSTQKINDNLKKCKDEAQKNVDEMNKAKDAIDDLLKLTIDMIKKRKELEKDALDEQLDGFKKLIDKKKEQLDLEKQIHDFQKDLKEKNTAVSDIQKNIDILSLDDSLEAQKKKAELEKELADKKSELDEFLYSHEVDSRKEALDKEEKLFEEKINNQLKAIEDYLSKEGLVRQDAMDLIDGRTDEFYNDLRNYATMYSDYTGEAFQRLWDKAYEYLEKYGNGQINVCNTLNYLAGQIEYLTKYMTDLENQANKATEAMKDLAATADGLKKVTTELENIGDAANNVDASASGHKYWSDPHLGGTTSIYGPLTLEDWLKKQNLKKYHTGGVVVGGLEKSKGSAEVLAKLLKGEIVMSTAMQNNLVNQVLPSATKAGIEYAQNNMSSPVTITQGDIIIQGNADQSTIQRLKAMQDEFKRDIFAELNKSTRRFGLTPNVAKY